MKNQRFFINEFIRFAIIVPAAAYNKKLTLFVVKNRRLWKGMVLSVGKTDKKIGMKIQVRPVFLDAGSICREYAAFRCYPGGNQEKVDWGRERTKIKEALLPFVREAVKKQMKEEREYFRSRPSLATRQFESIFGQEQIISTLTYRVCEQMEQQLRHERLRKGR